MKRTKCKEWINKSRATLAVAVLLMAIVVMAAVLLFPSKAYAAGTLPASGDGWEIDAAGNVIIKSQGGMDNFYIDDIGGQYIDQITTVKLEEGVEYVSTEGFMDITSLVSVELPSTVICINMDAFRGCTNLKTVSFQDGCLEEIGDDAFKLCESLERIDLPDSVTTIGVNVFDTCKSLTTVKLPSGLTTIPEGTFKDNAALKSITIPNSVTCIESEAFNGCESLANITLPEGLTTIDYSAFERCGSLTEISLPDGLQEIGSSAFLETGLSSITIPGSVAYIGDWAFMGSQISKVTFLSETPPQMHFNSFSSCPLQKGKSFYVPKGAESAYTKAWQEKYDGDTMTEWQDYISYLHAAEITDTDQTTEAFANTDIDVLGFTENATVYSVDVEWGAMTFQWENSTWDATAHQNMTGAGWKVYDSEKNKALASTTDQINQIQVTNHSNAEIWATLAYAGMTGYEDTAGSFEKKTDDTATDFNTANSSLHLDTANNGRAADGAGVPTVGTVYFMPSGIKEALKTNGITKWTQLGTITVGVKTQAP